MVGNYLFDYLFLIRPVMVGGVGGPDCVETQSIVDNPVNGGSDTSGGDGFLRRTLSATKAISAATHLFCDTSLRGLVALSRYPAQISKTDHDQHARILRSQLNKLVDATSPRPAPKLFGLLGSLGGCDEIGWIDSTPQMPHSRGRYR